MLLATSGAARVVVVLIMSMFVNFVCYTSRTFLYRSTCK